MAKMNRLLHYPNRRISLLWQTYSLIHDVKNRKQKKNLYVLVQFLRFAYIIMPTEFSHMYQKINNINFTSEEPM